jgi:hypothetical protein
MAAARGKAAETPPEIPPDTFPVDEAFSIGRITVSIHTPLNDLLDWN